MDDRKIIEENPLNKKGSNLKKKPVKKTKTVKFRPSQDGSRKNLVLIGTAILAIIVITALIFSTLTSLFSTETYYVLNTNVRAKQKITADMVVMRETAAGTGPTNSLSMEHIQRGIVYSRYPLHAGDVVAYSNAGTLSGQTLGVPDDWSITSFTVDSTFAVGGILGKGDYVDILGVDKNEGSRYIFNNILILDVQFVNNEFNNNSSGEAVTGEMMHYTVGMPAEEIAYFHSALEIYGEGIRLIKAPYSLNYDQRDVSELDQDFLYGPETGNLDLFLGSDPAFTEIERDENGKPVNILEYNEIFDDNSESKPPIKNNKPDNSDDLDNYNDYNSEIEDSNDFDIPSDNIEDVIE